jgi:hypothetical protein
VYSWTRTAEGCHSLFTESVILSANSMDPNVNAILLILMIVMLIIPGLGPAGFKAALKRIRKVTRKTGGQS